MARDYLSPDALGRWAAENAVAQVPARLSAGNFSVSGGGLYIRTVWTPRSRPSADRRTPAASSCCPVAGCRCRGSCESPPALPGPRETAPGQRDAHHLGIHHADDPPPHPKAGTAVDASTDRPGRDGGRHLATNINLIVVTPTIGPRRGSSAATPTFDRLR